MLIHMVSVTSKDLNELKKPSPVIGMAKRNTSKKSKEKCGSLKETFDNIDEYLNETLHNINLWMELGMQNISNDKTVRSNTVQDMKDFNVQSITTQATKRRTISFYDAC